MKRIREMLEERKNLSSSLKDKSPSRRKSAQKNEGGYQKTKYKTSAADLVGGGEISGGRIVNNQISDGFMIIMDSEKPHYVAPQFNSPTT